MKRVLFIDRDGTIIQEPADEQIDSLEKLSFLPSAITALHQLAIHTDYQLVMVTNQDGLGTPSFPEDTFWPAHNKMLEILEGVGVTFADIYIDRTFENDQAPTRKPGTGMLGKYLSGSYDLANSYVIGDRISDVALGENLGSKSILISDSPYEPATFTAKNWSEILTHLMVGDRRATVSRITNETKISVTVNLDGAGISKIDTGLGFFDHMLDQLARHGQMDIHLEVAGDLQVDEHHTIEDTAIALGEVIDQALGNKRGIERYGFALPMDDCLAQVALDFGGRSWLVWEASFNREKVGDMPTEMFKHFFNSFCDSARCNLNIRAEGENEHHKIESIFKAFARCVKMAVKRDPKSRQLPTTKGLL